MHKIEADLGELSAARGGLLDKRDQALLLLEQSLLPMSLIHFRYQALGAERRTRFHIRLLKTDTGALDRHLPIKLTKYSLVFLHLGDQTLPLGGHAMRRFADLVRKCLLLLVQRV